MKLLCLVVLGLAAGAAFGQRGECEDAAAAKATLSACIAGKAEEMAAKMEEKMGKKAERQAEMAKCFTDNGCDDPTPLKKQMKDCKKKAIMDGFGKEMIGCIERKGLDVPDVLLDKLFKGGKGKWGRKGGKKDKKEKKMKKLDALVAKVCAADSADAATAKSCAKALKKARKEERKAKKQERKANRKERRQQRREERRNGGGKKGGKKGGKGLKACFKEISRPCRRAVIADLCQCADPLKENPGLFADVREDIQQCKADAFGLEPAADDDDEDDEDADIDAAEAKRRGKKIGKLLKLVCGGGRRGRRGPSN